VKDYGKMLKKSRTKVTKGVNLLKKLSPVKLTVKDLDKIIEDLSNHSKVRKAYIARDGSIIVFSKMLYKTDYRNNKVDKRSPIGEFILKFRDGNFNGDNLIYIHEEGNYPHPNISGISFCWGDNQEEVNSCLRNGDIYLIFDITLDFLSIFPHADGEPYIGYGEWYEEKEKRADDYVSSLYAEAL